MRCTGGLRSIFGACMTVLHELTGIFMRSNSLCVQNCSSLAKTSSLQ
jgi:hypothetical protein